MKNPKISIITSSFNRKHLIEKLVESIRGQSYQNWELLIVDDDSSDGTVEHLTKLYTQDARIIIASRASLIKGANPCRNEGLKKATGDYLCFLILTTYFSLIALNNEASKQKNLTTMTSLFLMVFSVMQRAHLQLSYGMLKPTKAT